MKLIKPSFLIKEQEPGLEGIYKQIEWAGRHCYKSHDKITEDSAKKFVDRMIQSGHGAVLEHGTVYLAITYNPEIEEERKHISKYLINPYTATTCKILESEHIPLSKQKLGEPIKVTKSIVYVTTNYRVIVENNLQDDLKYLCEPTEYHEKRVCVRFICDRGVSHEYVRHRVFSFAQESTRYCNYSKDKFGNELTFIIPCWCDDIPDNLQLKDSMEVKIFVWETDNLANSVTENGAVKKSVSKFTQRFLYRMIGDEDSYIGLIAAGYKPQEARAVLPNALKTELVMTGFVSDWKHFFELRCDPAAHPQARELAIPLKEEFIRRGLI